MQRKKLSRFFGADPMISTVPLVIGSTCQRGQHHLPQGHPGADATVGLGFTPRLSEQRDGFALLVGFAFRELFVEECCVWMPPSAGLHDPDRRSAG